jgi:hypothetical protein
MINRSILKFLEELEASDVYALSHEHPDLLAASWLDAESDAIAAYDQWSVDADAESYAVYLAYADQADAAQDALAAASGERLA